MAGMILKEDVEKVRAAADLYDIVSASVTLRPSGTGTFVGLCPFHDTISSCITRIPVGAPSIPGRSGPG